MAFLFWILFIAYLAASGVLILVVLVQSGKGGGLSGLVGAGSALGDHLGATGAERALNRYTSYCAIGFLVINIFLVLIGNRMMTGSLVDQAVDKNATAAETATAPLSLDGTTTATAPSASSEGSIPTVHAPSADVSPSGANPAADADAAAGQPPVSTPAP